MECIFCRIVSGQMPCQKLYEDEDVISFLDIFPAAPGHSLIVPKKHYPNLEQAPPEVLQQLMTVAQKVAAALKSALDNEGFNLLLNNGAVAGQKVHHLHFHILPRRAGDDVNLSFQHYKYGAGEIEQVRDKVVAAVRELPRERLQDDLQALAPDKRLTCAQALALARQHQISSKELGRLLNQEQIKLRNCQLGCF